MGAYRRDDSASWYADVVHPVTGKRERKSLRFSGSKREADKRAVRLQEEMDAEAAAPADAITCLDAVNRYIERLQSKGKVFAKQMEFTRKKLFALEGGERWHLDPNMMLHDLTPTLMEALVVARTKEGNKPQTIRHEIGLLRSAARYVADVGDVRTPEKMTKGLTTNPWRIPEVEEKTRYLSQEEFQRVYDYLDPALITSPPQLVDRLRAGRQECRDLLVALAYTGGRWSEIASLKWTQIDFPGGTIKLWGNKTKQERVVPISAPLHEILKRRFARWTIAPHHEVLVFPGNDGKQRTAPSDAIGQAMDACDLNTPDLVAKYGRATVHSLRHTFASWLVQNGAELLEVSGALGHSSVTTTQRYAHLSKGATVAKLGGILTNMGSA